MIPHQQLFKHDPDNGIFGDCWRTCVASILNLSPEAVPHVHTPDHELFKASMKSFLASRGLAIVAFAFDCDLDVVQRLMRNLNPGVHYMLMGQSGRGEWNHIVVCKDGEIVHDTSGSGIVGPCVDAGDGRHFWIEVIAQLSPDPSVAQ